MARLVTAGFETQQFGTLGQTESEIFRAIGSPTVETSVVRSGTGAMQIQGGGATARYGRWEVSIANGNNVYIRAYVQFSAAPATGAIHLINALVTNANIASIRCAAGDTVLQMRDNVGNVGTASASLSTGVWHRIELRVKLDASPGTGGSANGTMEMWINGVQVGSTVTNADLGTSAINNVRIGQNLAANHTNAFYIDDVAINDSDTAGTGQTGFPGTGKIVLLKPVSPDTTRDAGWLDGAGGTSNLWDALNNIPPTGVAGGSAGATTQIRNNAGIGPFEAYEATTESYSTAGIVAADTVKVVQGVVQHSADTASEGIDDLTLTANPSGSAMTTPLFVPGAAGNTPSNWLSYRTAAIHAPSVTLGSGVTLRVRRADLSSNTADVFVDLLGAYVEYRPAQQITITPATETGTAQSLDGDKHATAAPATETDTAQALDADKHAALSAATETDTATALAHGKAVSLAPSTETDAATALDADKHITLDPATETDSAPALSIVRTQYVSIDPATETDTAVDLDYTGGEQGAPEGGTYAVTRRIPLKRPQYVSILPAYETNVAAPLTYRKELNPSRREEELILALI